ncbi:MAG: SDR family NAD(P)-dependent oxidoreductase [Alphaproteobacteria bacterium]
MPDTDAPLKGRHALITGGGRGIGAAVAAELAALGASLTLVGRDAAKLEETARPLGAKTLALDLADRDAVREALAGFEATILVNNAGLAPTGRVGDYKLEDWDATFAVNATGALLTIQAVLPAMRAAGWGRIVNVASTAGLIGYTHVAGYVASKHALIGLTKAAALDLAKTAITVNAVCPGFTDTDLATFAVGNLTKAGKSEDEARAILARRNPQGRLVDPAEVARAVGWLCLPGSAAVTGQAIAIDGGEVAG